MRFYLLSLFLLLNFGLFSQMTREIWTGIGFKTKLSNKTEMAFDLNTRSYSYDFQLFYPELTFKYKLSKWIKPSIDYRLLYQQNKYGNFLNSNRINFNLEFEKELNKRIGVGLRIRYQTTFNHIRAISNYEPDFDPTIRIKPSLSFAPKKSKFSYNTGIEFFFNPQNVLLGHQFSKYRAFIGTDINLKGPNTLQIKYLFGQNINDIKYKSQHIISIAYAFEWKKKIVEEEN